MNIRNSNVNNNNNNNNNTTNATIDEKQSPEEVSDIVTVNQFLFLTKVDNMNFFRLDQFVRESDIVKKLNGFVEKQSTAQVSIHQVLTVIGFVYFYYFYYYFYYFYFYYFYFVLCYFI